MARTVTKNRTIDFTIGLPPGNLGDENTLDRSQKVMENSMPIARIFPGIPSFTKGLTLFKRQPYFRGAGKKNNMTYMGLLNAHGYGLAQPKHAVNGNGPEGCLVLAYQADSFPTDSFSNEYGENFLQGLTSIGSDAAASLAQIRGARDMGEVADRILGDLAGTGSMGEMAAGVLRKGGQMVGSAARAVLPKSITGGIDVVSKLAAGSRIDFPMVWKGSAFQPSYTMTIRLYNPAPWSRDATEKYIAAPIAAIMLLATPVSTDGITYSWPFIHRIHSPGIYDLNPGFISNITVIKGGDQQQISYRQTMGIVDIRIEFGSLFNSMLAAPTIDSGRPTLSTYLDSMTGDEWEKKGVEKFSTTPLQYTFEEQLENTSSRRSAEARLIEQNRSKTELIITKNQAPVQEELTEEQKDGTSRRGGISVANTANYNKMMAEAGYIDVSGGLTADNPLVDLDDL